MRATKECSSFLSLPLPVSVASCKFPSGRLQTLFRLRKKNTNAKDQSIAIVGGGRAHTGNFTSLKLIGCPLVPPWHLRASRGLCEPGPEVAAVIDAVIPSESRFESDTTISSTRRGSFRSLSSCLMMPCWAIYTFNGAVAHVVSRTFQLSPLLELTQL